MNGLSGGGGAGGDAGNWLIRVIIWSATVTVDLLGITSEKDGGVHIIILSRVASMCDSYWRQRHKGLALVLSSSTSLSLLSKIFPKDKYCSCCLNDSRSSNGSMKPVVGADNFDLKNLLVVQEKNPSSLVRSVMGQKIMIQTNSALMKYQIMLVRAFD